MRSAAENAKPRHKSAADTLQSERNDSPFPMRKRNADVAQDVALVPNTFTFPLRAPAPSSPGGKLRFIPAQTILESIAGGIQTSMARLAEYSGRVAIQAQDLKLTVSISLEPNKKNDVTVELVEEGELPLGLARIFCQYAVARLCQGIGDAVRRGRDGFARAFEGKRKNAAAAADIRPIPTAIQDAFTGMLMRFRMSTAPDELAGYLAGMPVNCDTDLEVMFDAIELSRVHKKAAVYLRMKVDNNKNDMYTLLSGPGIAFEEKEYGPFKNIMCTTTNEYLLKEHIDVMGITAKGEPGHKCDKVGDGGVYPASLMHDAVATLLAGNNVILFGYGMSGSGKSHTLVGVKDVKGIFQLVMAELLEKGGLEIHLHAAFEEGPGYVQLDGNGKVNDMRGKIVVLYDAKGMRWRLSEAPFRKDQMLNGEGRVLKLPLKGETTDGRILKKHMRSVTSLDGIIEFFDLVKEERIHESRIRPTPNNVESSRTNLYVVYRITLPENKGDVFFTLADLAGGESAISMIQDAYNRIDSNEIDQPDRRKTDLSVKKKLTEYFEFTSDGTTKVGKILFEVMSTSVIGGKSGEDEIMLSDLPIAYAYALMEYYKQKKSGAEKTKKKKYNKHTEILMGTLNGSNKIPAKGSTQESVNSAYHSSITVPRSGGKILLLPDQETQYFKHDVTFDPEDLSHNMASMITVGTMYIEGLYIEQSIRHIRDMFSKNTTDGAENRTIEGVLTGQIFEYIHGLGGVDRLTRNIMIFTLDTNPSIRRANDINIDKDADSAYKAYLYEMKVNANKKYEHFKTNVSESLKFVTKVASSADPIMQGAIKSYAHAYAATPPAGKDRMLQVLLDIQSDYGAGDIASKVEIKPSGGDGHTVTISLAGEEPKRGLVINFSRIPDLCKEPVAVASIFWVCSLAKRSKIEDRASAFRDMQESIVSVYRNSCKDYIIKRPGSVVRQDLLKVRTKP